MALACVFVVRNNPQPGTKQASRKAQQTRIDKVRVTILRLLLLTGVNLPLAWGWVRLGWKLADEYGNLSLATAATLVATLVAIGVVFHGVSTLQR